MSERDRAKAEEIEITPEMIEAGFKALRASAISDDLLEADKLTVAEIYRAMAPLSPERFRSPAGSPSQT